MVKAAIKTAIPDVELGDIVDGTPAEVMLDVKT